MSNKKYLENDMDIAAEIQRRLNPKLCTNSYIDIAAWSMPCDKTGGDYYDFYQLDANRYLFLIGDASGHGLPAAMVMMEVRSSFLTLLDADFEISEIFNRVNERTLKDIPKDKFMTLFAGVINIKDKTLTYCSAGHDSPIWYRPSRGNYIRLESNGIPIGVMSYKYEMSRPIDLKGGDVLLFGTDGIWESINKNDIEYGPDRLCHNIETCAIADANILSKLIKQDLLNHIGNIPHRDDITLMTAIIK